jgi:hypothetical protein
MVDDPYRNLFHLMSPAEQEMLLEQFAHWFDTHAALAGNQESDTRQAYIAGYIQHRYETVTETGNTPPG